MKKPTIYFLLNSLDIEKGGLTKASLKQASMFAELGYDTHMLTFHFNAYYPYIRQQLIKLNKVHKNVTIHNMYEELEGYKEPLLFKSKLKQVNLNKLTKNGVLSKREGHNAYRLYENGYYTKYIALTKDNSLDFIDTFNENRYRTKREEFDPWGKLKRIIYMDFPTNKPRQTIYFNSKGNAYLSLWYNQKNNRYERINYFSKKGKLLKEYTGDLLKLKIDWLTTVTKDVEQPVIVSDTRSTDAILTGLKGKKAVNVWRLHSNHVAPPYKDDSLIEEKVKHGIANLDKFDGVFLLTEQQKKDISEVYGFGEKMYVIPHFHEHIQPIANKLKPTKKDEKRAVVISRLSKLKRIDHIVRAFKKVTVSVPDAQLEIYGKGTEEGKLFRLINELGLEKSVFLKGYTHDPDTLYKNALFSVLVSKSEGFSLAILESMTNSAPVISYDIKYGPNDLIQNDKNGYIVEEANIDILAEKMIYLFQNPKVAIKMGKQAKDYVDMNYNKKMYIKNWTEVIQELIENKSNVKK